MADKTEDLKKELELRAALLETKQCLGCMHEGMLVTTQNGSIVETSPAAEHILEAPSVKLKGKSIQEFCGATDVYSELLQQAANNVRSANRSLVITTSAGKKKLVNMAIQRTGEDANPLFVHVFQDCADLRTMEERLVQAERLATVGKFASQIAHEIRNPLNSISLNVELLEDEVHDNDEARGLIRSVLKELDRLNDIISEYLQFSRFPKPHLKRGYVDNVLKGVAASFKAPRNVTFHVQAPETTPELWLDEGLLRQVIDNLVRNAVEAIDGDGAVTIDTEVLDRFFVIRVRDTGPGIPAETQARLFEPFFTTKTQGTGLGLATSQQIIFEHNGHLLVESQPGKGSTFSILLPL
jgi:signal transduction histidine kinase